MIENMKEIYAKLLGMSRRMSPREAELMAGLRLFLYYAEKANLILETASQINTELDLNSIISSSLDRTRTLLKAERAFILLLDDERRITDGLSGAGPPVDISLDLAKDAIELKEPVLKQHPAGTESDGSSDTPSILASPLIAGEDVLGVLYLDSRAKIAPFKDEDKMVLWSLSSIIAQSIANAKLIGKLREAYLQTVLSLAKALEAKDQYTSGHSERVMEYSYNLGLRMGLDEGRLETLRNAALLHDIGKIGIRESVLNKAGKLTDEEFEHIKEHPELSEVIVSGIGFLSKENKILSLHHERYDGKGYPHGHKGDEMPIEAYIISVSDAFDAMTSKRAYRDAFSLEEAVEEIRKCAGTQFHPEVAEQFCELVLEWGAPLKEEG